jgi:Cupin superfamily protein
MSTPLLSKDHGGSNGNEDEPRQQHQEESASLRAMLGGDDVCVRAFFDEVWQTSCAVFQSSRSTNYSYRSSSSSPLDNLLNSGFDVLLDLMSQRFCAAAAPQMMMNPTVTPRGQEQQSMQEVDAPLLFRNCSIVDPDEERAKYTSSSSDSSNSSAASSACAPRANLFAAFLDGCSVVVNHADLRSPHVAALCEDLQRSLPHAYANAYVTPPGSQTAPAHTDDRDVFIVQLYGRKHWTVYGEIPVPFPFPHEQVGKDGSKHRAVPDSVLNGPVLIERILSPGDVLYMPRGYVHQATACDDDCSFHVTVALATHDWSLTGLLLAASESVLMQHVPFRKAVHRDLGRSQRVDEGVVQELQRQLDHALTMFHNEMSVPNIEMVLSNKYRRHNQRAASLRLPLIQRMDGISSAALAPSFVGPEAATHVTLSTWLRAATDEERVSVVQTMSPRGLHVREEVYEGILSLVQKIKEKPCQLQSLVQVATPLICNLTLISMARRCVELSALAICGPNESK